MGRSGSGLVALGMLVCIACGGGEEQPQGGGLESGGSGGSGGQGGTGGMVVLMPCTECQPMEGCLVVSVTRSSDEANQPWTLWPDEADGRGTLVVGAYDDAASTRRTVTGVDMTPTDAHYDVQVGCVPVGAKTLGVFLDDNENATASSRSSSDYLDSCPMNRSPTTSIVERVTTPVGVVLANSCD